MVAVVKSSQIEELTPTNAMPYWWTREWWRSQYPFDPNIRNSFNIELLRDTQREQLDIAHHMPLPKTLEGQWLTSKWRAHWKGRKRGRIMRKQKNYQPLRRASRLPRGGTVGVEKGGVQTNEHFFVSFLNCWSIILQCKKNEVVSLWGQWTIINQVRFSNSNNLKEWCQLNIKVLCLVRLMNVLVRVMNSDLVSEVFE